MGCGIVVPQWRDTQWLHPVALPLLVLRPRLTPHALLCMTCPDATPPLTHPTALHPINMSYAPWRAVSCFQRPHCPRRNAYIFPGANDSGLSIDCIAAVLCLALQAHDVIGRDVRLEELPALTARLGAWCGGEGGGRSYEVTRGSGAGRRARGRGCHARGFGCTEVGLGSTTEMD